MKFTNKKADPAKTFINVLIGLLIAVVASYVINIHYSKFDSFCKFYTINGIIKKIEIERGTSFLKILELDNNQIIKVAVGNSVNQLIKPEELCNFIRIGDRIIKEGNAQYIVICRNGIAYRFKVGDLHYSEEPFECE
jgi:hypothetical protein